MISALHNGLIAAFVLGLSIVLSACGDGEEREAGYYRQAKEMFALGQYEKAQVAIKNVLQINPKNIDVRYLLALIEEKNGNWRKLYQHLSAVVDQQPDHMDAQIKLGLLLLLGQQFDQAMEKADLVLASQPGNARAHALRASVLMRQKDKKSGEEEAKKALSLDPGQPEAIALLANLYVQDKRADEALALLDQGIKRNQDATGLHMLKITLLSRLGQIDKAERAYKELIAIYPDRPELQNGLVRFYVEAGKPDDAEKVLRDRVEAAPEDDQPKLALVQFLLQQGDKESAEKTLESFLKLSPGNYSLQLAQAQLYANQPDRATKIYEDIIERDGMGVNGLRARTRLASLAFQKGDSEEAQTLIKAVLLEDPKNSDALLIRAGLSLDADDVDATVADLRTLLRDKPESERLLMLLAVAHQRNGAPALAEDALQRAVQVNPRNLNARQNLAQMRMKKKDIEGAAVLLKESLRLAPNDIPTMRTLVRVYVQQKQWPAAEQLANALISAGDDETIGRYLLGNVYQAQGNFPKAALQYKKVLAGKPQTLEPLTGLISSYLGQGKAEDAKAYLTRVINDAPKNVFAVNLLGEVYLSQKNLSAAEPQFRKAIDINPKFVLPYLNLARIYRQQDAPDRAVKIYRQGLETLPGQPVLLLELAELYQRTGAIDEAIDIHEKLYENQPTNDLAANNLAAIIADHRHDQESLSRAFAIAKRFQDSEEPQFLDTYGWLDHLLNQSNQAILTLERVVQKAPNAAQPHYHLAMAYLAKNRTVEAKAELKKALPSEETEFPGVEKAREALERLKRASASQ